MNVFLDFDIGGDVDDMMCLALMLSCPEFNLRGISTTLWNVWERANEALTFLEAAERNEIPVACGCSATLAPNFRRDERRGYHEWAETFELCPAARIATPDIPIEPPLPMHGVDLLIDSCLHNNAPTVPILTGVLTNMAMALVKEPRIVDVIPQVGIMGGEFFADFVEHNIRCDAVAADIVFSSGIDASVIPFQIGIDCRLREEEVWAIGESQKPSLQLLYRAMRGWQKACKADDPSYTPCLFDPCVPIALLHSEFFEWKRGRVCVETSRSNDYAKTHFEEDVDGPHRIAVAADRQKVVGFFMERLLSEQEESASSLEEDDRVLSL